jgi:hypothetical protein
MLGLPLAFTAPWALLALAGLPLLYYVLRVIPPRPTEVPFPPLQLILDLKPKDETPARTPWWLLALRLAIAAIIILAMAGPLWNPPPAGSTGQGPLLLILDDGWPAAPTWDQRTAALDDLVTAATRAGRASAILAVSEGERDVLPAEGSKTLERRRAMRPVPLAPDRLAVLPAISRFLDANPSASLVWLSDEVDAGSKLELGSGRAFAESLAKLAGSRQVTVLGVSHAPLAITSTDNGTAALDVEVIRSSPQAAASGRIAALDIKGLSIAESTFDFGSALKANVRFELPIELRNEIARIALADEHSAGAVSLLDSRWKRRRIGLATGATADLAQPLLSPTYYLTRALAPFADVREAKGGGADAVLKLLDDDVSVMVLADVGALSGPAHDRLAAFVEAGGVLVRFAGVRLAANTDDLVPVRLRRGGRVLGGSLSWETPKRLNPFERESPFFGLTVPDDVTIARQVLAEPEAGLAGKTWAALVDGTPLVTALKRGKGLIVLVHVTADTTWSNLPLSGLFVDMMHRITNLSGAALAGKPSQASTTIGEPAGERAALSPYLILDGFGMLGPAPVTARPIADAAIPVASSDHPPGFYGPADSMVAINTLRPDDTLAPIDMTGLNLTRQEIVTATPIDLRVFLIPLAILAFLLDTLASLWLASALRRAPNRAAQALAVAALVILGAQTGDRARAADAAVPSPQRTLSPRDLDAVSKTRLAYVLTGDSRVDEASRLGLGALSHALAERTTLVPGDPVGIDPASDELAFYPLIYWPIVADRPQPSAASVTRIAEFMKQGGSIIFDTRDALSSRRNGPPTAESLWLRQLLTGVDVPELEPVPKNHVATRTFYILDGFVGRYTIGETWIEALPPETGDDANRPARAGDSVSPLIITSNDLAGAWAADRYGEPLYPLVPGSPRQRELALRGGINLVMYALTGNYKADQVHVPYLLERLAH